MISRHQLGLPTKEDLAIPDPEAQLVAALHIIPDWTVPFLAYMTRGELPEDEPLARQITWRSKSMTISDIINVTHILTSGSKESQTASYARWHGQNMQLFQANSITRLSRAHKDGSHSSLTGSPPSVN